jgi:hypothetical protein
MGIYRKFSGYMSAGGAKHSLIKAVAKRYHRFITYYGPDDGLNGIKSSGDLKAGFKDAAASIPAGADVVVLFRGPSYFTGRGHFAVLHDYTKHRFRMSDPNRKGRHGDSERKKGWSTRFLLRQGHVIKLWVIM